jgi:CheY-like chemotaxis protein
MIQDKDAEIALPESPLRGTAFLIADDEAHLRLFLEHMLKTLGCPLITLTSTGEQAVVAAKKQVYSHVLLDITMPGAGGLKALEQLRRLQPRAWIVMLTSQITRNAVDEARLKGADQYLRKDALARNPNRTLAALANPKQP